MSRIKILAMSAFLIAVTLVGCVQARRPVWKFYAENEEGWFVYDVQSLSHQSKNTVRVWTKTVYSEQGMAELLKKFGKGDENISYTMRS